MMSLEYVPVWYLNTLVFVFGACIGSFLNVVIYRLPAGKSVVHPRSQCRCGAFIAWYDNLPILSWFLLRGKCRHCGEGFSIRYPLVELGTALIFLGLFHRGGMPEGLVWCLFAGLMIPAAMIDWDTMEIPDRFSTGGFVIGVLMSILFPQIHGLEATGFFFVDGVRGFTEALNGAFIGSGLILWVALVAEVVLRKEAMGFGDVKLMGAIGAFCGWQGAVFAFFGGAVFGMLLLVVTWPFLRKKGTVDAEAQEGLRVPFGPSLVAGALIYLLIAEPYVTVYFSELQSALNAF